ncbi:hypothetical protein CDL15_Pgr016480 [Punica granatum]|uniref:Uncharacterized protein n=1 Tax=Punica granatum TaxID=22663 RepID=A0A218X6H9_PUNGR|nr:hypothetical protein CDL15_Pgr016480 [Punica granatum]
MQPKRGKLSAPHFGPPASYTRIFDQGPGYYSSPEDQRRTCGHGIMKYGKETWSTEKTGESNQKGKQATNLRATGAGTVALFMESNQKGKQATNLRATGAGTAAIFITESPKHRKVPNMGL